MAICPLLGSNQQTARAEFTTPQTEVAASFNFFWVAPCDCALCDCIDENGVTTLHLWVSSAEDGKLIGKQGRTARSLRTILSAAGMKVHRRYALNIEEEAQDEPVD